MICKNIQIITLLGVALATTPVRAGIKNDLDGMFDKIGAVGNITKGGYYESQASGYFGGGSMFMRTPARNAELFSMQMPDFRAGCGGIDLFLGGFSFINSQNLIQMMRNIGSNAVSYAFGLALQTVSPQIKSILDELSAKMQEMNNTNLNSCNAAASMVGSMWPRTEQSSKFLCSAISTHKNIASDYAAAQQGCGAGGARKAINAKKNTDPDFKDMLGEEYNLAWQAIHKSRFLDYDNKAMLINKDGAELAEIFMSISGTVVSKVTNSKPRIQYFPSLLINVKFLDAFIKGGKTSIYRCDKYDENECMNPKKTAFTIPAEASVLFRVLNFITSIKGKIVTGVKPTAAEKAFIESTNLPILKILAVESAFLESAGPISGAEFAEAIAYDIVLNYLGQILAIVSDGLHNIASVQIDAVETEKFINKIHAARDLIYKKRYGMYQQINTMLAAINRTRQIEQQMFSMFIERKQAQ